MESDKKGKKTGSYDVNPKMGIQAAKKYGKGFCNHPIESTKDIARGYIANMSTIADILLDIYKNMETLKNQQIAADERIKKLTRLSKQLLKYTFCQQQQITFLIEEGKELNKDELMEKFEKLIEQTENNEELNDLFNKLKL